MAILFSAELRPGKLELLNDWLPTQPWACTGPWTQVATYRFDDPDGEVGMETFLLQDADGGLVQVPLSYRGSPLEVAGASLITEMEHSVLGPRWVYDATTDPVYVGALATEILTGGGEAEQFVDEGGELRRIENTAIVRGTGERPAFSTSPVSIRRTETVDAVTHVTTASHTLHVLRRPEQASDVPAPHRLVGEWQGTPGAILATLTIG